MKEIPLTQGKVALVDDSDFALLSVFRWRAVRVRSGVSEKWYAVRSVKVAGEPNRRQARRYLHREILGLLERMGLEVDHLNGDGLDNRRSNLRCATAAQNQHNQRKTRGGSSYKGVHFHQRKRKWRAVIYRNSAQHFLGEFFSEEDAARAYDAAAREHFGEFACVNFPAAGEHGCRRAA
jgi:hypothetical protein